MLGEPRFMALSKQEIDWSNEIDLLLRRSMVGHRFPSDGSKSLSLVFSKFSQRHSPNHSQNTYRLYLEAHGAQAQAVAKEAARLYVASGTQVDLTSFKASSIMTLDFPYCLNAHILNQAVCNVARQQGITGEAICLRLSATARPTPTLTA